MQCGFVIYHNDGHRWINFEAGQGNPYIFGEIFEKVKKFKIKTLRSKIYGSYDEALDEIDRFLVSMGFDKLEKWYIDDGGM